ncbi:helix-turn-helix domain-containing protein [Pseudomonas viridiflava]|uniref:helix-turn-helix domain-containing protein n=1 Tax=Pseudomonas viridiflava TaxID=33069 RepID=UPI000F091F0F|nr:helix-turn-helix transcriptional regulator [Pseudomonas viridiflava]
MSSEALVQLALEALGCTQKDLAFHLGVSATQISKWKKGEHLSLEMEKRLRELSKIGNHDPDFVVWSGSRENASKWETVIRSIAEVAQSAEETGYTTDPLIEPDSFLCWTTFNVLKQMGVDIPKVFPPELNLDKLNDEGCDDFDEGHDSFIDAISGNNVSSLIYDIFRSFTDVYSFYAAYVADLANEDFDVFDSSIDSVESNLMSLAASKLNVSLEDAPNFKDFKYSVEKDYKKWLGLIKDKAFRAGIPLRSELLSLVYSSHDGLGHNAEAESLGFNASRLHPDVYMNELLEGMRIIHQVLPVIMKKLGIEDEFQLDTAALRIT